MRGGSYDIKRKYEATSYLEVESLSKKKVEIYKQSILREDKL